MCLWGSSGFIPEVPQVSMALNFCPALQIPAWNVVSPQTYAGALPGLQLWGRLVALERMAKYELSALEEGGLPQFYPLRPCRKTRCSTCR